MLYLWLKAFHVMFVISWFAGIFYLPRLFVYHADTTDTPGHERFIVMERRLYKLMNLAAALAVVGAAGLLWLEPAWLSQGWLQWKLALVIGLVVYHIWCGRLMSGFRDGRNRHSARWYRFFNEIPALLLIAIVSLAIVKPG